MLSLHVSEYFTVSLTADVSAVGVCSYPKGSAVKMILQAVTVFGRTWARLHCFWPLPCVTVAGDVANS